MNAIIGESAPEFVMDTYFPEAEEVEKVNLDDFKGKWLIIIFYPADFTFVCPTELRDMAERYSDIVELGGEVLAVSTDTVFTHKAWLESEKLLEDVKYPMAADHNGKVAIDYGVYIDDTGLSQRGTFIIDPDGILRAIYTVDEPIGRSSSEIVRLLKALKFVREHPGSACPARWDEGSTVLKPSIKIAGHVFEALEE
jgi:peroxiredoxin (alkyl hydroperoxide reductase subunit C)